jgi:hypothetical protein
MEGDLVILPAFSKEDNSSVKTPIQRVAMNNYI